MKNKWICIFCFSVGLIIAEICSFIAHLSRMVVVELVVQAGIRHPSASVLQHFQTTSLTPWSRFLTFFTYSVYRQGEWIIFFFFCPNRIRTLVATKRQNLRKNIDPPPRLPQPQKPLGWCGWNFAIMFNNISPLKLFFIIVAHVLSFFVAMKLIPLTCNGKSESILLQIFWQKFYRDVSLVVLSKPLNLTGCHGNQKDKFAKKY